MRPWRSDEQVWMQAKHVSLVSQNDDDTLQVQLVCDFKVENLKVTLVQQ